MGNELSRCLKPNASLKLGRSSGPVEPDYESEVYKVAAGNMVAVAASPTSMKARLDVGGSEQQHRQQLTDLLMLQAENALDRGASGDPGAAAGQKQRKINDVIHIESRENTKHGLETSGSTISCKFADSWPCLDELYIRSFFDNLKKPRELRSVFPCSSLTLRGRYGGNKEAQLTPDSWLLPHPTQRSPGEVSINGWPLEPPKTPKSPSPSSFPPAAPFQSRAPLCSWEDLSESCETTRMLLPAYTPEQEPWEEELELSRSAVAMQGALRLLEATGPQHTGAHTWATGRLSPGGESAAGVSPPEAEYGAQPAAEERSIDNILWELRDKFEELRKIRENMEKHLEKGERVLRDLGKLLERGPKARAPLGRRAMMNERRQY